MVNLTIMHTNPRGWTSKQESLLKLTKSLDPDIININETQLTGTNKVEIKSFTTYCKNRSQKAGGGICSAVSNRIKQHAVCVAEGGEDDEWLALRYDHLSPALTVVNCYGEQEGAGESNKQKVVARWGRLLKVLEAARLRGDHVLLVGDLNKHVGCDQLGVPGNKAEVSTGGRLVRDLVEGGNWRLLNAMTELVKGGPFTRRDPANGSESLLDLWLCTAGLAPYLKELIIDSNRSWEVARPVLKDGRLQLTYTDHYVMVATFHNLPAARVAREEKEEVRWKSGSKETWLKYKEESKEASRKIAETIDDKEKDIDEVLEKVEAIETKLKFKTFGKYTVKSLAKRKEKVEKEEEYLTIEERAEKLLKNQTKRVDEAVNKVKESGQNKVGQIFKISQEIKGTENGSSRANAIKHPRTGKLVVDQDEIKQVSLKYCQEVLTKNKPHKEFETMAHMKEILHNKRMNENIGEGFMADKEVFEKVLHKFKKNNKRNYDCLLKASEEFKDSVFKLCKRIIEDETVPNKFRNTTLHQIWKKKPGTRKEDLDSNRHVHCKDYLPRTVESMVVNEMEPSISAATSIFQIGGVAGHRPQEHLFCLKSIQAKYERDKKLLILYPHDASKFFDKEVLVDIMDELYKAGVDPRAYRLFFYLNQATRIRVKTGCGYSSWGEAGDSLGQGSGAAAKVSALNLDRKLERVFGGSKQMLKYGNVQQQPYCFLDDSLCMVDKVEDLGVVVHGMETVMNMMQVQSNQSKCGYILIGPKHLVQEARKKLDERPIKVGDWVVKELQKEKWLGDQLCNGLSRSVMATIQNRAPKIRRAAYEILNIVKDYRAQRIGGFATALLLWESCAIPSLIYNCSTWVGMGRGEEEALAEWQDFFVRLVLRSGPGAPKHALRADFGSRNMKLRVWKEKLMLIHYIRFLEDGALTKTMYGEQAINRWPGRYLFKAEY